MSDISSGEYALPLPMICRVRFRPPIFDRPATKQCEGTPTKVRIHAPLPVVQARIMTPFFLSGHVNRCATVLTRVTRAPCMSRSRILTKLYEDSVACTT